MIKPGDIFGRLIVLKSIWIVQPSGRKRGWLCKCSCGHKVQKHGFTLQRPLLRGEHSCGCAQIGLPRGCSKGGQKNNGRQGVSDPTPEEIRERCLEIQLTWTEDEFAKRRGDRQSAWEVPVMSSRGYRDQTGEFL
jgi:hypothetical protein